MIYELYSIYDKLAEEYGPVFQAKNKAIADRNYNQMLTKQNLNPEEYQLYKLSTFDNETGEIDVSTPH